MAAPQLAVQSVRRCVLYRTVHHMRHVSHDGEDDRPHRYMEQMLHEVVRKRRVCAGGSKGRGSAEASPRSPRVVSP